MWAPNQKNDPEMHLLTLVRDFLSSFNGHVPTLAAILEKVSFFYL
jgi:hypothetical protein